MKDFIVRRGLFWVLQWLSAALGILTFGYVDPVLASETWYLNMMEKWVLFPQNPK